MVLLSVDGVECRYGSVKILENVNFTANEGDFVGSSAQTAQEKPP